MGTCSVACTRGWRNHRGVGGQCRSGGSAFFAGVDPVDMGGRVPAGPCSDGSHIYGFTGRD